MKDGLRPPAESDGAAPDEGDRRSPAPVPVALPPGWLVADESLFNERANQLFVAAIACRTAWRPVSSTPLPDPAVSARLSSSGLPLGFSAAEDDEDADAAEAAGAPAGAARKPAPGVFGLRRFLISSAGNGTGVWLDAAAAPAALEEAPEDEDDEASVTASAEADADAGAGSAPLRPAAALAADRDVPDADDADGDVPDRVRDEDMVPLSSIVSAVSASGSTSWTDGATITDGSVARPALSTPSSSVPNGAPFVPSAEIT